ncbi:MAG TPA: IS110 family transposase [Bryobacteraceae bacterium]|nr:IS110 family transposase [Bryobacteraceae bacterium]
METKYQWFVGIDWGGEAHQVCVLDRDRRKLGERSIKHDGEGIGELIKWVGAMVAGEPAAMAAALEVPHGPIVEALLACGVAVFAINPKQVDRFRDRYTVNGAKDDRRDAYVIAALLVTDIQAFKKLTPESPFTMRVRELSRTLDDLDQEHRRLSNQLRDLLVRYFPAMLALSPAADEPWIWALLATTPLPAKAKRLSVSRIEAILKANRIRRISAVEVRVTLQQECLDIAPHSAAAIAEHVGILVPLLRAFDTQYKRVSCLLKNLMDEAIADPEAEEHRVVRLLRSLPGIGLDVSTTLLAEAGGVLADADGRAFRCYAGIAPITKQSGKSRRVVMRHGCNQRMREACYHWARTSVQRDANSRSHYDRLRQAGHNHGRALRGVCDRLITILMAVLRTGKPYNPEIRRGAVANRETHLALSRQAGIRPIRLGFAQCPDCS